MRRSKKPTTVSSQADVTRLFWALFLGAEIQADGQVTGFRRAWDRLSPWAQRECDRYAYFAWVKVERDHRDPDECVRAGVSSLRERLRDEPPEPTTLPRPEEVRAMVATICRGLSYSPQDQMPSRAELATMTKPPDETWPGWNSP